MTTNYLSLVALLTIGVFGSINCHEQSIRGPLRHICPFHEDPKINEDGNIITCEVTAPECPGATSFCFASQLNVAGGPFICCPQPRHRLRPEPRRQQVNAQSTYQRVIINTRVGLGESCQVNQQCPRGAICKFGSCICPDEFRRQGNMCGLPSELLESTRVDMYEPFTAASMPFGQPLLPAPATNRNQPEWLGQTIGPAVPVFPVKVNGQPNNLPYIEPYGTNPRTLNVPFQGISGMQPEIASAAPVLSGGFSPEPASLPKLRVAPGQGCRQQNLVCTGGAHCFSGVCQCPDKHMILSNHCVERMDVKDNTASFDIPMIPQVAEANGLLQRFPDEPCDSGTQCKGGSFCNNSICKCPPTCSVQNRKCTLCVAPPSELIGNKRGAPIPDNFTDSPLRQITSFQMMPGQSCSTSQFCVGGSFCFDRLCACPPNFIAVKNVCIVDTPVNPTPAPTLATAFTVPSIRTTPSPIQSSIAPRHIQPNQFCIDGTDRCTGGSRCIERFCRCPPGLVPTNGLCLNQATLQTTLSPTRSSVLIKSTPFPTPSVFRESPDFRFPTKMVTSSFFSTSGIKNMADLNEAVAEFERNYYKNLLVGTNDRLPGKTLVLPNRQNTPDPTPFTTPKTSEPNYVNMGASCIHTEQCINNAFCIKGKCRCNPGDMQVGNYCIFDSFNTLPKSSRSFHVSQAKRS